MPLRDRQRQIPNSLRFWEPVLKWKPPPWASFDQIVTGLIIARQGNPGLCAKYGWSTDRSTVEREVDEYNTRICQQNGWLDFIITQTPAFGGGPIPAPFPPPPPQAQNSIAAAASSIKKIWAGARTLDDWLDSGEPPVSGEQSTARALACSDCKQNGQGDFTKWFTRPAAEVIKRQLEKLHERNLSTPHDDKINVCEVCHCPMKLKVHTPLKFITKHQLPEVLAELNQVANCWIPKEIA